MLMRSARDIPRAQISCSTDQGGEKFVSFVGEPDGKRSLRRPSHRRKVQLVVMECKNVNRIQWGGELF